MIQKKKLQRYIENSEGFQYIKTGFYYDGMNIEIKKHQYILIERIEEDIITLSESLEEVSQYS